MIFLMRTPEFDRWLKGLRDTKAKAKILVRLDRLSLGNAGDVAPVGEGVSEMRIRHVPATASISGNKERRRPCFGAAIRTRKLPT